MDFLEYLNQFLDYEILSIGTYKLKVYSIVLSFLVFLIAKVIMMVLKKWLDIKVNRKDLDVGNEYAILTIASYLLWILTVVIILEILGIDVTILTAGSAALLVGIGLGIQSIFMDFLSGIVLLLEGENKVNDIIEFDNRVGIIKRVGIRTSEIQTFNDTAVIVPNSKLINNYIVNWSHTDKTARYSVKVSVSYRSDVRLVEKLLIDSANEDPRILKIPAPFVRMEDFGDNGIVFSVYFWTKEIIFSENIRSDCRYRIFEKFKEHGIEIPFPQRVVTMVNT
jgi:small-conductance mechanosensitive channel